jgi:KipI family sensor histidine kinase inhibitor
MSSLPRLLPAGDCALVVEYGNAIDAQVNARVRQLDARLAASAPAGILETVPTYRSLMIHYDPFALSQADLERLLREADVTVEAADAMEPRTVEIPVAYGGPFGPDLADVATLNGLSADEVVAIHAAGVYPVFMLGFMPGFPYLGGMSGRIRAPRLPAPRTSVPAGSVGIAGDQTGIYPAESPGGWRLIGRTPVRLFDPSVRPPALLAAGDRVAFRPISPREFDDIARAVAAGTFAPIASAAR